VHAILVTPRDPAALAAGIEAALSDPAGMRNRAIRARQRVEQRLSFDARMRSIEEVYDRLMNGPPRGEPELSRRCS
jgi:glycosyltransferase involved in cell wall biosynthesis